MPVFNLFSKRQKKLRGDIPEVYVYDDLPNPLRVKIVQIWLKTIGNEQQAFYGNSVYDQIVEILRHEYGVFQLPVIKMTPQNACQEFINFFLQENDVEKVLDAVELSFRLIDGPTRDWEYLRRHDASKIADDAIDELNYRFMEHGIGYQFSNGQIIRMDSELIHAEIVKPALELLNQRHFAGAQQEFLKAHEHYRKGNAKEALNECLKAFESVMKAICDKRGWKNYKKAAAKDLIVVCFDNGLIPSFWQSHYTSLRNLLESSVPTGRNKLSGHGQGTTPVSVPNHLVAYMLHMTASTIVFLAEAEKKYP